MWRCRTAGAWFGSRSGRSARDYAWVNLTMSGTTLNAAGGGGGGLTDTAVKTADYTVAGDHVWWIPLSQMLR